MRFFKSYIISAKKNIQTVGINGQELDYKNANKKY